MGFTSGLGKEYTSTAQSRAAATEVCLWFMYNYVLWIKCVTLKFVPQTRRQLYTYC